MERGYRNHDDFILTNLNGGPVNPEAFTSTVRTVAARAGVKLSPHQLRHLHASQWRSGGIHPKMAQLRPGHSTIGVTMDINSHLIEGMEDEAVEVAAEVLRKVQQ